MALEEVSSIEYAQRYGTGAAVERQQLFVLRRADSRAANLSIFDSLGESAESSAFIHFGASAVAVYNGSSAWQTGDSRSQAALIQYVATVSINTDALATWGDGIPVSAGAVIQTHGIERHAVQSNVQWSHGYSRSVQGLVQAGTGNVLELNAPIQWGAGAVRLAGALPALTIPTPPLPPIPPPVALLRILPARYFLMSLTIYIERLADSLELPFYDFQVSTDVGSFCWAFSGTGHPTLQQLLTPVDGVPTQIRAVLDGISFVFAVDKVSRSSQFGSNRINVVARSVTSSLSAPYALSSARTNQQDMTALQIGTFALQDSGIDLDFGVGAGNDANGGLVDWLVPAGAFSVIGTPLQAVQAVVEAAGGCVQSHRSLPILLARHPYGARIGDAGGAPWQWMDGSADVELAPDALITESIERNDGADINGVYVSGTTQGVLGLVKITGSAGDRLGQIVTDPLITHFDAARQRGLSILGASGKQQRVTLDLPVLMGTNQPGILDVGQLVQVNASSPWRGRVRAVSVSARSPTLRQSITLERHI